MDVLIPNDISNQKLRKKTTQNARVTKNDGVGSFGKVPKLNDAFPEGEIVLKLGSSGFFDPISRDLKKAFGLRHIWDKHRTEIGATTAQDVVAFVESVLQSGAEILIDKNKDPSKPLIVESSVGMVIVELKQPQGEDAYYSIITAYDRKSHPGTLVGNLV
ncbi:hypothetical protein C4H01_RS24445 [Vibrio parahaemolyticus]|nr:hypothetical protein [Vibrio parahaemolyticus]EJG1052995.1 hypothetical protein [Vibrio parahaemolyticus]